MPVQTILASDATSALSRDVWLGVVPMAVMLGYFLVGAAAYALRVYVSGRHRDVEIEGRGSSALLGMDLRLFFGWVMQPLWQLVLRSGLPPAAITTLSVLFAAASGVAVAADHFALAGWLYLASGLCDFFDGRLARATSQVSEEGAALDSVLDRYGEAMLLAGLAWYFRGGWVMLAVFAALLGSLMTSYVRARGEGLGVSIKIGLMQRPERMAVLGLAITLAPLFDSLVDLPLAAAGRWLAVVGIMVLAVATNITAIRRFLALLRALATSPRRPWRLFGRASVVRSSVSAAVATGFDFIVFSLLVAMLSFLPGLASLLGSLVGGVVNFGINRVWAFRSSGSVPLQAKRYVSVSLMSAVLNAGGLSVLLLLDGVNYTIAWFIVRGAVSILWNYQLHRDFVFPPQLAATAATAGTQEKAAA